MLTIPVQSDVLKQREVRIVIAGVGMQLPYHRMNSSYDGFQLSGTCKAGNVIPIQISNFSRIGQMRSSLDFPVMDYERRVLYQIQIDTNAEPKNRSSMETLSISIEVLVKVNASNLIEIDMIGLGLNHTTVEGVSCLPTSKVSLFKFDRKTQSIILQAAEDLFPSNIISVQIFFNSSQQNVSSRLDRNSAQTLFVGTYITSTSAELPISCNNENSIRVSQLQVSNAKLDQNHSILYALRNVNLTKGDVLDLPFPSAYVSLDCGSMFDVHVYGSGNFSVLPIISKGILSLRTEQDLNSEFIVLQFSSPGLKVAFEHVKVYSFDESEKLQSKDAVARMINYQSIFVQNHSMMFQLFDQMQNFNLKFTSTMMIQKKEKLTIRLTSFEGDDFACIPVVSSPAGKIAFASWRTDTQQLSMTLEEDVQSGEELQVHVPWYSGIRLPPAGVTENQTDLTVSTNAAAGPVPPTPISYSPSVGVFWLKPALSFDGGQAGEVSGLRIAFGFTMDVEEGSVMEVQLPNFTIAMEVNMVVTGSDGSKLNATAMSGGGGVTLKLRVLPGSRVKAYRRAEVAIPKAFAIQIPMVGVARPSHIFFSLNNTFSIGADSVVVGSFDQSVFVYLDVRNFSSIVQIYIRFKYSVTLVGQDVIRVHFQGFQGPNATGIQMQQSMSDDRVSLSWLQSCFGPTLFVQVAPDHTIEANQMVTIVVPSTVGIRIPYNGIRTNFSGLIISTDAQNGPVYGERISAFNPIGYFTSVTLDFEPKLVTSAVSVLLSFEAQMVLRPGDTIMLNLPGLTTPSECFGLHSNVQKAINHAHFSSTTSVLRIDIEDTIEANVPVSITIPRSAEFRLPPQGLVRNYDGFFVSAHAKDGNVAPTRLSSSPAIGSVHSRLSYDQNHGDERVITSKIQVRPFQDCGLGAYNETFCLDSAIAFASCARNSSAANCTCIPSSCMQNNTWCSILEEDVQWSCQNVTFCSEACNASTHVNVPDDDTMVTFAVVFEAASSTQGTFKLPVAVPLAGRLQVVAIRSYPPKVQDAQWSIGEDYLLVNVSETLDAGETVTLEMDLQPDQNALMQAAGYIGCSEFSMNPVFAGLYATEPLLFYSKAPCTRSSPMVKLVDATSALNSGGPRYLVLVLELNHMLRPGDVLQTAIPAYVKYWSVSTVRSLSNALEEFDIVSAGAHQPCHISSSSVSEPVCTESVKQHVLCMTGYANKYCGCISQACANLTVGRLQVMGQTVTSQSVTVCLAESAVGDQRSVRIVSKGYVTGNLVLALEGNFTIFEENRSTTVANRTAACLSLATNLSACLESNNSSQCACIPADCWNVTCNALVRNDTRICKPSMLCHVNATVGMLPVSLMTVAVSQRKNDTIFEARVVPRGNNISVSTAAHMAVSRGEGYGLTLTGFEGDDFACVPVVSSPAGKIAFASWRTDTQQLSMTLEEDVQSGEELQVHVPWYSGIRLPPAGVTENQTDLTVSTNAAAGPVPPTPISYSPSVGVFWLKPALSFDGGQAGEVSGLRIAFGFTMDVEEGSVMEVQLPNFTIAMEVNMVVTGSDGSKLNATAMSGGGGVTLKLRVLPGSRVKAYRRVEVGVSPSAGIGLPYLGIVKSKMGLTFALKTSSLTKQIRLDHPALGAFLKPPTIRFLYPVAGEVSGIEISFTPAINVSREDTLRFLLPGFESMMPMSGFWASDGQRYLPGMWSLSCPAQTITLFPSDTGLKAGEEVTITVPHDAGIQIPALGVRSNSTAFRINFDSYTSPIADLPFRPPVPIGFFHNFTVDFVPKTAGSESVIVASFTPEMNLHSGDTVGLILKNFTRADSSGCIVTLSQPPGVTGLASWSSNSSVLTIGMIAAVRAGQHLTITIPSSSGLMLPKEGLDAEAFPIKVESSAVEGPVLPTVVHQFPAIGSLLDSVLSFSNTSNGTLVLKEVFLSFSRPLSVGDSVIIYMPGVQFRCNVSCAYEGLHFLAIWTSGTQFLKLVLRNADTPPQNYTIILSDIFAVIQSSQSIDIARFQIKTLSAESPVEVTDITKVIGLSPFRSIPIVRFSQTPTLLTDMQLSFYLDQSLEINHTLMVTLNKFQIYSTSSRFKIIENDGFWFNCTVEEGRDVLESSFFI
ncbi:hypothetical protein GUITHDRAFT_112425 [Guillardia theta CCMP2712]|uniref:Uncharacterized protein n=1 Tax=Guillardia theta (strain CCMP2712) TaxID=905079 RepID=L1IZE5_GUITC|nr:hypothetical protein GUITHDRAFT_112425 [Guillardia theta CCMP2712]EKX41452.1 hypothetical protein GUITHDRAFT_112425 [Guillardia theta CCMP2712]|eukprot:XP_005828432.1 hypothetical protein GUITHDRAFT_112425 [Guillardia theta CCMP2712]